jgi:hypothetical protein
VENANSGQPNYSCEVSQVLTQLFPLKKGDAPTQSKAAYLSDGYRSVTSDFFKSKEQVYSDQVASLYVGKTFVVNRLTGVISGGLSSSSYLDHKILKPGDSQSSFILLVEGNKGAQNIQNFIYLEVAQFSSDLKKPFKTLGLAIGGEVLMGNCIEH